MSAHRNKKPLQKLPVFPWKNRSKQHSFFNHFHCCTTSTPSKMCFIAFHSSTTRHFERDAPSETENEMKTYSFELTGSFWKHKQNIVSWYQGSKMCASNQVKSFSCHVRTYDMRVAKESERILKFKIRNSCKTSVLIAMHRKKMSIDTLFHWMIFTFQNGWRF